MPMRALKKTHTTNTNNRQKHCCDFKSKNKQHYLALIRQALIWPPYLSLANNTNASSEACGGVALVVSNS